jgi:predicted small lipoprotein YifL
MKKIVVLFLMLVALAALTVLAACSQPSGPAVLPAVDSAAATSPAATHEQAPQTADGQPSFSRRRSATTAAAPLAAPTKPDQRTPQQIVAAACAPPAHCVGTT